MDQETSQPLIPCIYCNHSNPASHRFCGMCSKALPDLVKKSAKPIEGVSGAPIPGSGVGLAGRAPDRRAFDQEVVPSLTTKDSDSARTGTAAPPQTPPPQIPHSSGPIRVDVRQPEARRVPAVDDNPNRDLSYLLQDDHVPARTSRAPFVIGALLLAAVAAFFALRGGSKPTPAPTDSVAGDMASTPLTDEPPVKAATHSKPADAQPSASPVMEPGKMEPGKIEPKQPEQAEPQPQSEAAKPSEKAAAATGESTSAPVAGEISQPSVAAEAPAPKLTPKAVPKIAPTRASAKKPSPGRQQAAEAEDSGPVVSSVAAASSDCEKQLPSLRRAAGKGDAKARADLGLIYYAGRCVPRDLPTAYRWYALALRSAPDSPQVSAQLEAIWKQMSPAERQLALKPQ